MKWTFDFYNNWTTWNPNTDDFEFTLLSLWMDNIGWRTIQFTILNFEFEWNRYEEEQC